MTQSAVLPRWADLGRECPPVLRLGLATRGNTHLEAADVAYAVRRGVNCLNWCGYDDGLARALHERLVDREQVVVAMQLESRDARFDALLRYDRKRSRFSANIQPVNTSHE